MKKGLITQSAYKKISTGHPWLTATDFIDRSVLPTRPCAFHFGDSWWFHSPASFLRLRRFGPAQVNWMKNPKHESFTNADQFNAYFNGWLLNHLSQTLKNKIAKLQLGANEDLCLRWIFSENDLIPGLIVDVFGDTVVVQLNSAPIEIFWFHLRAVLLLAFKTVTNRSPEFYELRNSNVRLKEGLMLIEPESAPPSRVLNWNGFQWQMTPAGSQKTGAYFDQRQNHLRAAEIARDKNLKTAWDLCSYQGGFSLHLLKQGLSVTAVDQSEKALASARENVQLNSLPKENFKTEVADIFVWLKNKVALKEKVDLLILDPPSFVKSRNEVQPALRGYKELNALALQCLNPGGVLVSCVCSHHVTPKLYEQVLRDAAAIAKCSTRLIETRGPSPDHSPAPGFSEGHYLQAWFLEV